ncbi:hypothetical protein CIB84_013765, partial [Bambusicola thoracicus]
MPIARPTGRIHEAAWTSGIRELTEPWKGALGCLGVAVFFAMTIGIISWQALEQPPEEWMLRGQASGMLWDRRRGALLLRALPMGRPLVSITVGSVPASEPPPPRDRCWQDGTEFCYAWEEEAELRISLQPTPAPGTECYSVRWTPLRPDVMLKDCFSMANVSWYGGASLCAQRWPLNSAESPEQPFVSGDFSKNPTGSPIWQYDGPVGSAAKIKRGLRSLARRLKRHRMQEGVLALGEHGTAALATMDHVPAERRKRHGAPHAWDPAMIFPLRLSITLSPYTSIAAPLFLHLLRDGETGYWLSLQPRYGGCSIPLLTTWKGQLCARLNITNEAALSWYLSRARGLRHKLGATYVIFEGAEGNAFLEQAMSPPAELAGDQYAEMLAAALVTLGNATVISVGA